MSNVITLDSIREEVEKEFAPLKVGLSDGTEAVLKSLVRLNEKARKAVLAELKVIEEVTSREDDATEADDVSALIAAIGKVLELVCDKGRQLAKEIDGDLLVSMKLLTQWMEATQAGEAQNSPSA